MKKETIMFTDEEKNDCLIKEAGSFKKILK